MTKAFDRCKLFPDASFAASVPRIDMPPQLSQEARGELDLKVDTVSCRNVALLLEESRADVLRCVPFLEDRVAELRTETTPGFPYADTVQNRHHPLLYGDLQLLQISSRMSNR